MRLHLVSGPAVEPLTLAEAKTHRRVDGNAEDALITDMIIAARELFEEETGRQVNTATWRMELDRFPRSFDPIRIPKAPLIAVSSVAYRDTTGATQTWDAAEYEVDAYAGAFARPGVIYPKAGFQYPSTHASPGAVSVTFTAGYGAAAADVPESVKATIKSILGDMYEEREGFITGTVVSLNPAFARALHRFRVPVYA